MAAVGTNIYLTRFTDGEISVFNSSNNTLVAAPSVPTSVYANAGDGQATVNFTPGSNGGSPILYYTAVSNPGGISATSASASIAVTGLTDNTSYTFTVTATNAFGTSSASSPSGQATPVPNSSGSGGGGGGGGGSSGPAPSAPIITPSTPVTNPTSSSTPAGPSSNSTPPTQASFLPSINSSQPVKLINDQGTFYLVENNQRFGITNPGILNSYGLSFSDASAATAQDLASPLVSNLSPYNGALVKGLNDPTVYLISIGQRYGFTSASVFGALGFKFSSVLTVTAPELSALPLATNPIKDSTAAHNQGVDINDHGTVYWIGADVQKHPYPSLAVYNSWHIDGDFSGVVPANAADLVLPTGASVVARVIN